MTKLNATAKATLKEAGISQAAWARANFARDGKWSGDECGCTDDRCANGFHHMGTDDCGCLLVLIGQYFEWLRGAEIYMFDKEAPEYRNRVVIEDRRQPAPDPSPAEREAFAAVFRDHAGLFVALSGTEVLASGTDFGDVQKALRDKGLIADTVMRIPPLERESGTKEAGR